MKKLIIYILFIPCIITMNNLVNLTISNNFAEDVFTNEYPYQWVEKLHVKPKIVLVGSCTTQTGYSAKELQKLLGLRDGEVINLATAPSSPEITYFIVKKYIDKFDDNALILYGFDPEILSEVYYHYLNILLSHWSLRERISYISSHNTDFPTTMNIVNGGNVFMNIEDIFVTNSKDTKGDDYGSTKYLRGLDPTIPVEQSFCLSTFHISQRFLQNFAKLDNLVYQKHRKMIVYYPAYSNRFMKQYIELNYHNNIQTQLHKVIKYSRFEDQLTTHPDSCYLDLIHISLKGKKTNLPRILRLIQKSGN